MPLEASALMLAIAVDSYSWNHLGLRILGLSHPGRKSREGGGRLFSDREGLFKTGVSRSTATIIKNALRQFVNVNRSTVTLLVAPLSSAEVFIPLPLTHAQPTFGVRLKNFNTSPN